MIELPRLKRCSQCREIKTLEEFHQDRARKYGRRSACNVCVREYSRKYRETNPEKARESAHKYRQANLEKARERNHKWHEANRERTQKRKRRWYKDNRERSRETSRKWREANLEKTREDSRRWREANLERVQENERRYRQANPEKIREKCRRRRARENGAEGNFTEAQFQVLCEYYGSVCIACGSTRHLTRDHVILLTKGGSDNISNIQPLCRSCNSSKGAKDTDYRVGIPVWEDL